MLLVFEGFEGCAALRRGSRWSKTLKTLKENYTFHRLRGELNAWCMLAGSHLRFRIRGVPQNRLHRCVCQMRAALQPQRQNPRNVIFVKARRAFYENERLALAKLTF